MPESPSPVITLQGSSQAERLSELRDKILSGLQSGDAVVVPVESLTGDDPREFQLIDAAWRHARAIGMDFRLSAPADGPLLERLGRMGVRLDASRDADRIWLQEGVSR